MLPLSTRRANSVIVASICFRVDRDPVTLSNKSKQIDAIPALEATGSDVAIAPLKGMRVVKPYAAMPIGSTLCPANSRSIPVDTRKEFPHHAALLIHLSDRVHQYQVPAVAKTRNEAFVAIERLPDLDKGSIHEASQLSRLRVK